MNLNQIIGQNLKYLRYKKGLSQEKFYSKYNLDPKYLASIERGEINISVNYLQKLAAILKVNVLELLKYDDSKQIYEKRIDSKKKT